LLKPMSFTVLFPILIVLASRSGTPALTASGLAASARSGAALLAWGVMASACVGLAVLAIGASALYEEFVTNRLLAARLGWSLQGNWKEITEQLDSDLPLVGLAAAAIWPLARAAPLYAIVATSWLAATLLMLLFYSPLHAGKQAFYLLPPAALLAAGGIGATLRTLPVRGTASRVLSVAPLGLAVVWYVSSLPLSLSADWKLVTQDTSSPEERSDLADVLALLARVSSLDEYIVTDHPYVAFLANRRVPPRLAEPSRARLASRSLRQQDFVRETRRFKPAAVVFWSRRSSELTDYAHWLDDDYRLVRVYGDLGAVYVPKSGAASVVPGVSGSQVSFGDTVGLASVEMESRAAGRDYLVTLTWEALKSVPSDSVAHLELQAPEAISFVSADNLLPAWRREPWPPRHRLVQRRWLDLDRLAAGEYLLTLRVTHGPGNEPLNPAIEPGAPLQAGPVPGSVTLERVVLP
jgi:hypothetical protein